MQTRVTEGVQLFRRASGFLVVTDVKPTFGVIATHYADLNGVIERMSADAVRQEASDRAYRATASAARLKARRFRRVYLRPFARMAETLFPNDPTLREALTMPAARGYERLIAVGQAMAERAAEYRERFVAAGLGENFVDQLKQAALDLQHAVDIKSAHVGHRAAASKGMLQELKRGRGLIRLLDAMVGPWLEENDPDRLAEWRTLTRFVRVAQAEKPETPPVPTPAASEITEATTRDNVA